jgi:hypothetical protein
MKLKKSDESVFQLAIDCMNTAETGYSYLIANEKQFSDAIKRLEYFKETAANCGEEEIKMPNKTPKPVIKFKIEQDENGKIVYRVTKIDGFPTKTEINDNVWISVRNLCMKNENNHNTLVINLWDKSQTFEEGEIVENVTTRHDIENWKNVIEDVLSSWKNAVDIHNKQLSSIGEEMEMTFGNDKPQDHSGAIALTMNDVIETNKPKKLPMDILGKIIDNFRFWLQRR